MVDGLIQVAPRHRRMPSTIAAGLPPLRTLGEPVTFTSPHAAGIDLNIDYETEIKPFIGRKLVSWLVHVCDQHVVFVESCPIQAEARHSQPCWKTSSALSETVFCRVERSLKLHNNLLHFCT